ncbi:hypothetical protein [Telmatospirillum sp.]|uniref:hypothetical protein n=1 Tax=Telmatospirillum sp. TaxID=2079197 RepID=UPI00283FFF21|nr:hypothetical protein [Telmatospirillum sp.]MDR3437531.1 hypothetical protein [Telmatospirillum sp.]
MSDDVPDVSTGKDEERRRGESRDGGGPSGLVLVAVTVLLVIGGYFLAIKLKDMAHLQDCVMSGRSNCAPITSPQH